MRIIVFATLIVSGILGKDLASFSWNVWFYANQKRIAAEKCENKAKPMMHCDGKCYLSKQLKKLDQQEKSHNSKQNPFQKMEKSDCIPFEVNTKQLSLFLDKKLKHEFYFMNSYRFLSHVILEKPPKKDNFS